MSQGQATKKGKALKKASPGNNNSSNQKSSKGPKSGANVRSNDGLITAPLNSARMAKNVNNTPKSIHHETRSEFIGNLTNAASPFTILSRIRCNAGSETTFPWLSTIAKNFERYNFRKLKFRYLHRCSATTNGSILFSPDYDAADTVPITEAAATAFVGSRECSPWVDFTMEFDSRRMNRQFKSFVVMDDFRFTTTKQDQKTIDAGQLFIFGEGDTGNWGKLWVDYEVDLYEPAVPIAPPWAGGGDFNITSQNNTTSAAINPILAQPSLAEDSLRQKLNPNVATMAPTAAQLQTLLNTVGGNPVGPGSNYASGQAVLAQVVQPILAAMTNQTLKGAGGTVAFTGQESYSIIRPDGSMSNLTGFGGGIVNGSGTVMVSQTELADPTIITPTGPGALDVGTLLLMKGATFTGSGSPITSSGMIGGVTGF